MSNEDTRAYLDACERTYPERMAVRDGDFARLIAIARELLDENERAHAATLHYCDNAEELSLQLGNVGDALQAAEAQRDRCRDALAKLVADATNGTKYHHLHNEVLVRARKALEQ